MELDYGVRGLIKLALLPPGGLLLLLLVGLLLIRRFLGRLLVLVASALLWLLSMPMGSDWLARGLETVPALSSAQATRTGADAILVLLADRRRHNPEYDGRAALSALSLERLNYALHLQRLTGLPLILSGGAAPRDEEPLAAIALRWVQQISDAPVLGVETDSMTTWQNLQNTRRMLDEKGAKRLLLVTHAFHMPRALQSARNAGLDVVAAPFGFIHTVGVADAPSEITDWLPDARAFLKSYLVLHEYLGGFWYSLRAALA